jgi:hypothetical protein
MASRTVMKLSWKWRSGLELLRVGFIRPSGRGGKIPHAFGDDERIAGWVSGWVSKNSRDAPQHDMPRKGV